MINKEENQNKIKLKACRLLLDRYAKGIFEYIWIENIYGTYLILTQCFIKTLFLLLEWNVYSVYRYENEAYLIILYFKKVSTKACLVFVYCWKKKNCVSLTAFSIPGETLCHSISFYFGWEDTNVSNKIFLSLVSKIWMHPT